jgi:hypothetical protein
MEKIYHVRLDVVPLLGLLAFGQMFKIAKTRVHYTPKTQILSRHRLPVLGRKKAQCKLFVAIVVSFKVPSVD